MARALVAATEGGNSLAGFRAHRQPRRLVHGPFGSGKTHALAAFVVSAAERLAAAKSNARILISAHTNVAVRPAPLRAPRGVSRNTVPRPEPSEGSITRFYRIRYTSPRRGVSVRPEMAERNRC